MSEKPYHVSTNKKSKKKWNVKKEGSKKASKSFDKKSDAEKYAKEVGKKNKTEVIIHKKDGKIQKRDSYGNDPYPPKG